MSQEKVDRYKEQKVNRKKIMKQEKIKRIVTNCVAALVLVAAIGWIGYSSYTSSQAKTEAVRTSVEVDTTAVTDYLNQLGAE